MTGEGFEVGLEPDDEQQHCDTEITERPDEVEIGNSGHAQHEARCEEVDERWEAQQRGRETEDDNGEQVDGRGHGSLSYQSYVEPHRRLPTGIGRYSALTRERGRGIAGEPVRDLEVPPARGCGEEDDAGPRERD